MIRFLRRMPFTLAMVALIFAAGAATDSLGARISPQLSSALGFAPRDLWTGRWDRLFTGVLFSSGGLVFWGVLAMTALMPGLAEWFAGTRRAFLAFWGGHLGSELAVSLLIGLPLELLGGRFGAEFVATGDPGPSSGCYSCLGLAVTRLPGRLSRASGWALLLVLAGLLVARPGAHSMAQFSSDLAHPIAFALGWMGPWLERRWRRRRDGAAAGPR